MGKKIRKSRNNEVIREETTFNIDTQSPAQPLIRTECGHWSLKYKMINIGDFKEEVEILEGKTGKLKICFDCLEKMMSKKCFFCGREIKPGERTVIYFSKKMKNRGAFLDIVNKLNNKEPFSTSNLFSVIGCNHDDCSGPNGDWEPYIKSFISFRDFFINDLIRSF